MKIRQFFSPTFPTYLMLLAALGCQTAKKPSSAVPPVPATTPSIQPHPHATGADSPTVASSTVNPKPKPAPEPAEARPDPVQQLLTIVGKEYQAGLDDSKAGRNASAQEHFERAISLLQGSPASMRSNPRFEEEYNRVLAGVNASVNKRAANREVEDKDLLAVSESTDAAVDQKSRPAPIDEANEVTNYPVDPSLKAKATADIKATHSDLPLMMTDQVAGYINYFSTRGHGTLEHALERSGRYRQMIERILRQEGVPQDLIYLAQAESGFYPYAVSRVGARGIWQFMASRARAYDLHRDFWTDERQDPEKSTRAAARHLRDLYNEFGDWYLAMAAYNSGPGTVQSAVKRTGYADFWELYRRNVLPKETRNYVPIILAVTIMAKNPAQYGLDSIVPDHELLYETIKINYPVDLRLVADCVGASPAELQDLNPSLLRMITPKGQFELHVPVGSGQKFQDAINSIPPDMRVWWRYHQVVPGDTLMSLARYYHTTLHAIVDANQLNSQATIEPGAKLVIPIAPSKRSTADVQTYAKRVTVYHVRKNDTVESVAENLGVAPVTLRHWNRLKGNSLGGRRVLYVHLPVSPQTVSGETHVPSKGKPGKQLSASKSGSPLHHTVKRGETLYSIATSYNTSVSAIKQTNAHLATLRPGMVLVIPPSP
jgi:membrane-bound lytic murein transglycosylase D